MTSTSYFTALDWAMAAALSTTKKMPHVGSGKRDGGDKNGGQGEDRISIANKKRPLVTDEQGLPSQTPVNQKFRKVSSLMLSSVCYYEQDVFGNWLMFLRGKNCPAIFLNQSSSSTVISCSIAKFFSAFCQNFCSPELCVARRFHSICFFSQILGFEFFFSNSWNLTWFLPLILDAFVQRCQLFEPKLHLWIPAKSQSARTNATPLA